MTESIRAAAMAHLIAAGTAAPLLPEGVPGPARLHGRWWAIPTGQDSYRPVADPDLAARLDHDADRYARLRATLPVRTGGGGRRS
ncbi:hypothetical protein [Solihabitans fulvus]|uniref:hypothetical protein n=1 Tax=Solihabitans fulvus TaxID=1892852 RepID=UPI001661DC29|nr:hypothetical protein [Solihabitans fulvus]